MAGPAGAREHCAANQNSKHVGAGQIQLTNDGEDPFERGIDLDVMMHGPAVDRQKLIDDHGRHFGQSLCERRRVGLSRAGELTDANDVIRSSFRPLPVPPSVRLWTEQYDHGNVLLYGGSRS